MCAKLLKTTSVHHAGTPRQMQIRDLWVLWLRRTVLSLKTWQNTGALNVLLALACLACAVCASDECAMHAARAHVVAEEMDCRGERGSSGPAAGSKSRR